MKITKMNMKKILKIPIKIILKTNNKTQIKSNNKIKIKYTIIIIMNLIMKIQKIKEINKINKCLIMNQTIELNVIFVEENLWKKESKNTNQFVKMLKKKERYSILKEKG